LLVKVIANGSTFWEYYIGGPKGNPFYSKYQFLEETDPRCRYLTQTAFKDCQKIFTDYNSIAKVRPIMGAWLSFARAGGNKEYPFLKEDFFYYGGGMLVRSPTSTQNEENCKEDAETMVHRLSNELVSSIPIFDIPEVTKTKVLEYVKNNIKGFRYSVNIKARHNISKFDLKELKLEMIGLYERGDDKTGKIYYIGGTNYLVNSKLEIYLNTDTRYSNLKTFETYTEALLFKCSLFPLNKEERNNLKYILKLKEESVDDNN
jgi:hypothetical protein